MRVSLASAVVIVGLAAVLPLDAAAQIPAPIFRLPFDGTLDAQRSGGRAGPLVANDLSFVPGVSGQAIATAPNTLLEYATEGNLIQERGTVSLWFKPNWRISDLTSDGKDWHCLFTERLPDGKERIGSGMLWFWFWGPTYRGDISDSADLYKTAGAQGLDQTTWAHLAFSWDIDRGSRLYMNGIEVGNAGDGNSPLDLKKGKDFKALASKFASFYIGSQGGTARADGQIDEFRIFSRALTPTEIAADMATVAPMRLDNLNAFVVEGATAKARWNLTNAAANPADFAHTWTITKAGTGNVIAQGQVPQGTLAPGERREFSADLPALAKGEYKLAIQPARGPQRSSAIWALGRANPYLKAPGKLETTPVETIDLVKGVPADRLIVRGESKTATLAGRSYYEAGPKKNDRFAIRVSLPEDGVPYLVEWDYPDDKLRTMEMIAQTPVGSFDDYALQTGVFCGDEYPNSMQTLTHRSILWARSKDTTFIFMTARANAPAAVSALRISRINGGLPDGNVQAAAPVGGWTRTVGIHFEDPAIGYDFGVAGQLMPHYEQTLDRLVAYMKWSGQDLLSYPAVWYHGRIGLAYQPRAHEEDFIGCILTKFAQHDLGFMPAINLHNIAVPEEVIISEKTVVDGSLHSSPVMILSTGKPNPGQFHGSPPNFNPLHPAVQRYVDQQVDDLLLRYGSNPAFKGVVLHLTKHTNPWFGTIEAGYNDYCIDAFEKDTGIRVDVGRQNPLRGKLYYDWLMANPAAREQWVQWRCQQIAKWYRAMADRVSARRPDLKLSLFSYSPTVTDFNNDKRYGAPDFALAINRESGLDPKLYADASNIILSTSIYPADYRWSGTDIGRVRPLVKEEHMQQGTYALLANAQLPWVNMHDRYFEDGIGGAKWWGRNDPLQADWLKEAPWRVSVLNPNYRYFLEHYVLPLRYSDILGYTKGGFLIGTAGVEEPLLAFSKAFRALPAAKFSDLPGATPTTKARVYKTSEATWFYAINTTRDPVSVTFTFDRAPGAITDLAADQPTPAGNAKLAIQLAPYELRSFRAGATATPTSVVCESAAK